MKTSAHHKHPAINGTAVKIGDRTLSIPGYRLLREVGKGANAVVFEALDEALNRNVAVKIWNSRGLERAQSEAAKIAAMNHSFIVSTYFFGRIEDYPYCVMEMIPGVSGKTWIKQGQSIEARFQIWNIYSAALQYIHSLGGIHGDPHLGNILVATNSQLTPTQKPADKAHISAKLADAGTSEFWDSHSKIEAREATLILETAGHLFSEENFSQLWQHPAGLNYKDTLAVLQAVSKYLHIVYGLVDWDRRSGNADILADLIVQRPFFDIGVVLSQVDKTGITTADRLIRRLNARLYRIHKVMEASDEVDQRTIKLYAEIARQALDQIAKDSLQRNARDVPQ